MRYYDSPELLILKLDGLVKSLRDGAKAAKTRDSLKELLEAADICEAAMYRIQNDNLDDCRSCDKDVPITEMVNGMCMACAEREFGGNDTQVISSGDVVSS